MRATDPCGTSRATTSSTAEMRPAAHRLVRWRSGAREPRRIRAALHHGLELVGQACVHRGHGHATPVEVVDDLARVPQRPDLLAGHLDHLPLVAAVSASSTSRIDSTATRRPLSTMGRWRTPSSSIALAASANSVAGPRTAGAGVM